MNIKEKEQIELLSKVIGRRINHENDSYIATRIWDGCCTYLSANRQLFSTFKNGIPEYHVEEAIKVVITTDINLLSIQKTNAQKKPASQKQAPLLQNYLLHLERNFSNVQKFVPHIPLPISEHWKD